jgi:hypothetical protein
MTLESRDKHEHLQSKLQTASLANACAPDFFTLKLCICAHNSSQCILPAPPPPVAERCLIVAD